MNITFTRDAQEDVDTLVYVATKGLIDLTVVLHGGPPTGDGFIEVIDAGWSDAHEAYGLTVHNADTDKKTFVPFTDELEVEVQ